LATLLIACSDHVQKVAQQLVERGLSKECMCRADEFAIYSNYIARVCTVHRPYFICCRLPDGMLVVVVLPHGQLMRAQGGIHNCMSVPTL
jgi:hypothetical protein